jgi:hypothetical protein
MSGIAACSAARNPIPLTRRRPAASAAASQPFEDGCDGVIRRVRPGGDGTTRAVGGRLSA